MDEPDRQIHTEIQMAAYEGYIPDEWASNLLPQVLKGSVLEQLLLDLMVSWRTTSYTAQMPATAIKAMHAAALGRGKFVSPDSSIVAYTDAIIGRLSQKVPELVENRPLRTRLVEELAVIADEMRNKLASVKEDFPIEPIWADFLTQAPFRLSLWASQRVSYVAFYNTYEAFLVDCAKVALGVNQLRATDKEFLDCLRTGVGSDVSGPCWTDLGIQIVREVRHALSHAGGRETQKLKKFRHGIELREGVLQVIPGDIHRMLQSLRKGVEAIVAIAQSKAKFTAARP